MLCPHRSHSLGGNPEDMKLYPETVRIEAFCGNCCSYPARCVVLLAPDCCFLEEERRTGMEQWSLLLGTAAPECLQL